LVTVTEGVFSQNVYLTKNRIAFIQIQAWKKTYCADLPVIRSFLLPDSLQSMGLDWGAPLESLWFEKGASRTCVR
jgi:hypothetical protein